MIRSGFLDLTPYDGAPRFNQRHATLSSPSTASPTTVMNLKVNREMSVERARTMLKKFLKRFKAALQGQERRCEPHEQVEDGKVEIDGQTCRLKDWSPRLRGGQANGTDG